MASAPDNTSQAAGNVQKAAPEIPAMTMGQEDAIIHTRITNDEKVLRKVTKKFYSYTTVAYSPLVPPPPGTATSVDDARDAFLVDLASLHLSLKKSLMVCEAEARQVEEYQRERERIENEHALLREQIDGLKLSLEQAQLHRRRKIEYDVIAEKINSLPSREELEQSITAIENDMAAIKAEHENQNRILQAQQTAMDSVITAIQDLRLLGKQDADAGDTSRAGSPSPEEGGNEEDVDMEPRARAETGEISDGKDEGEIMHDISESSSLSKILNPSARPFVPHSSSSRLSTPLLRSSAGTPLPSFSSQLKGEELEDGEDNDIEMGELAEEPEEKVSRQSQDEELEEGEASDLSSELSEPPDD